jgi:hypothetical protein
MQPEKLLDSNEFETNPGLGESPVWPPLATLGRRPALTKQPTRQPTAAWGGSVEIGGFQLHNQG